MNINGVILTQEACDTLLSLQADDNSLLKTNITDITTMAKKMAIEGAFNTNDAKSELSNIAFLFSLCDMLESLFARTDN